LYLCDCDGARDKKMGVFLVEYSYWRFCGIYILKNVRAAVLSKTLKR